MIQKETYFESFDGTKLYLYRWETEASPKAVVHIVHGMGEHAFRYKRLAEKLAGEGIEVWAADQRGHGKTADLNVNDAGKGGLLGHCADGYSMALVTKDINVINSEIHKSLKTQVPVFLLGHSWGSFISQNYIECFSDNLLINGCMLSGTRGPGSVIVKIGAPFLKVLTFFCGQRNASKVAWKMADGPYNKPFKPNRTPADWLTRDESEVDKFIADPLCGKLCSSGFYRDLAKLLYNIHKNDEMAKIKKTLPIYVFAGNADPVGDMGAGPTALINAYRKLEIKDIDIVLYPGARHETLNETNREEVMENLISWIKKRC